MFEKVTIGEKAPEVFRVVIEIPRGSQNKYEFDEEMEAMKLDRVVFSPFFYPTDYGFIPQTRSEDGDHLDVLVLSTNPLHPGVVVSVRPIALLRMRDSGDMDEKILGVALGDPRWAHIEKLDDLSPHTPKELEHFFSEYKKLEGKSVEVLGWEGREEALKVISQAHERWVKPS